MVSETRLTVTRLRAGAIPLLIALATLVTFFPALWNGFLPWDDETNLVNNPHYRGLGWPQLRWMFTTTLLGHWIPLTWLSFALDYLLWRMNPTGYHLTNLLLHAANAALFYLLALRLLQLATPALATTPRRLGAATAALFFALHPLRAESVAWATERRDVLSGLFFLLTILAYLHAHDTIHRRRWLAGSVALYALALASKSTVMTLPFVLLLLDLYPLRRPWRSRSVWTEKLPFLLLALAGASVALYAVADKLTPLDRYLPSERLAVALHSLWFYLWKTALPFGLVHLYELPTKVSLLDPPFLLSAILVAAISAALVLMRRRWPAGLAVWAYYVVTLAPVSGILHVGSIRAADRYSYLSCLGWALLVGAGVPAVLRASANGTLKRWATRVAVGAAAAWVMGLAALTWQQVQVWHDTETLWRHALEFEPDCALCHNNLGSLLYMQGSAAPAIEHFQRAVTLMPGLVMARHNLGVALGSVGRLSEAVEHFQWVLERNPADAGARSHLGIALFQQGKRSEGIAELRQAIQLAPTHVEALANLGVALTKVGNPAEAVEHFRRAIELEPENPIPRVGLARAYLAVEKTGLARQEYEALKRLHPGLASQLAPLLQQ